MKPIKTAFAKNIHPITGQSMKKPTVYVNTEELEIRDDPLPIGRVCAEHKYHPVFDKMKPGQSIRCTTKDVQKVSCAMRKYLAGKGNKYKTQSTSAYLGDAGYGRVWMLALPVKAGR